MHHILKWLGKHEDTREEESVLWWGWREMKKAWVKESQTSVTIKISGMHPLRRFTGYTVWRWWKEKTISHRGQLRFSGQTRSLAMLRGLTEVLLRSTEISRPPVIHLQTSHAGVWYWTLSTMPSTLPHLLYLAKRALHHHGSAPSPAKQMLTQLRGA